MATPSGKPVGATPPQAETLPVDMGRSTRILLLMRGNHAEWQSRRIRGLLIVVLVAFMTLFMALSIGIAFLLGHAHPTSLLMSTIYGLAMGFILSVRPWSGIGRRHLWASYADAMLVGGNSPGLPITDRLLFGSLTKGVTSKPVVPSLDHLEAVARAITMTTGQTSMLLMAHLQLGLAANGVDLRDLPSLRLTAG